MNHRVESTRAAYKSRCIKAGKQACLASSSIPCFSDPAHIISSQAYLPKPRSPRPGRTASSPAESRTHDLFPPASANSQVNRFTNSPVRYRAKTRGRDRAVHHVTSSWVNGLCHVICQRRSTRQVTSSIARPVSCDAPCRLRRTEFNSRASITGCLHRQG